MKSKMKLGVYTIEQTLFEGTVTKIIAKTVRGEIAILKDHIPLITELVDAPLLITTEQGEQKEIVINGGFLEIQPENSIVVLVGSKDHVTGQR